ncbi:bifunctional adenosylcobinamide kinase/adenosylcobinamide-phosphate guanylyltransferase [Cellvibrio sp. KY-YJ-3]|uniref:bifunctional adenosylcobinamide kinase/adenosylcobinamide-phosphate guanylyltransferase n=1 Tax=Cellvibrio sp. KY-YJ-3 TaxID=454662 RepID=UPI001245AA7F|nr:bifunctional adenosylcobinamide kinase/adenosylcobinamide-phosphate guanylyltransferase [Cellvibrio sp. KY-YJ-3]QEY12358.1 bifunctional adenosylcobinamide kinase/adenosylcobinamide-phosphate guanylyltransferase [Cellvibrio sp. KY-YJ-3]
MITLVLGGARSGKSRYAEQLASNSQLPVLYIATATALDEEMSARIAHHQTQRPSEWALCECPLQLAETLARESQKPQCILVDCLTLWLNNQLFHYPQQDFSLLFKQLIDSLQNSQAQIIFVANEVGLGIIPLGEISRQFVDEAGRLNQALAQRADTVFFIAAGLPLQLKGNAV